MATDIGYRFSWDSPDRRLRAPGEYDGRIECLQLRADALTFDVASAVGAPPSLLVFQLPGDNGALMADPTFIAGVLAQLPLGGVVLTSTNKRADPLLDYLPCEALGLRHVGSVAARDFLRSGRVGAYYDVHLKEREVGAARTRRIVDLDRALRLVLPRLAGGRDALQTLRLAPGDFKGALSGEAARRGQADDQAALRDELRGAALQLGEGGVVDAWLARAEAVGDPRTGRRAATANR